MTTNIKNIVITVAVMFTMFFIYDYFKTKDDVNEGLYAQSALLEKQLKSVSKLVVTEASYAKVYNYYDKDTYGLDIFYSEKRVLIISNAKAQISYNLRELKYDLDPASKTITITYIPKPELTIDPNLQYYRMENGYFNKFQSNDLNDYKKRITEDLRKKITASDAMKNAENRLLSELSQIYVLTSNMEWTLVYNGNTIESTDGLESFLP